jgi:hypothetical protein
MNIQDAIDVIESVSGFTDESTPVGEAWIEVLSYLYRPTAPPPPVAEEVAELVEWLEAQAIVYGDYLQSRSGSKRLTRAATLLLQQQHLMSLCATEVESLMEQQTTPVVPQKEENREFVLKEMKAEDGSSLGWYVNHSDFYCDIQKEDGVWGVYFRDKITDQDAYGEPNETNE